jgi:polyribonucleotide nucleotidyltransferase
VLSHDLENNPDIPAMIGASAALTISGLPFLGPIGAARVGHIDGQYVLNPREDEVEKSALDLIVAGTSDGVLMVESEAKELSEEIMLGAVVFGHDSMRPVIAAIIELAEKCAKEPWDLPEKPAILTETTAKMRDALASELRDAYTETQKQLRYGRIGEVKEKALAQFVTEVAEGSIMPCSRKSEIVRGNILKTGRIDGPRHQDGAADLG